MGKKTKASKASLQPGDIVPEISGGTDDRPTGGALFITAELLDSYDCPVILASFCRLLRLVREINSVYLFFWLQGMCMQKGEPGAIKTVPLVCRTFSIKFSLSLSRLQ